MRPDNFGFEWTGYLQIPTAGIYAFELGSDDGSVLELNGQVAINNDGNHGYLTVVGLFALEPGLYPVRLRFHEAGGDAALALRWANLDQTQTFAPVPDSAWYHAVKPRDLNAAGDVGPLDLAILLAARGTTGETLPADLNHNLTAGDDADVAAWLGAHGLP